jgi:NAD(P)-dependent dehydrogenase (short-subunit alcohol dehydrogenase family)
MSMPLSGKAVLVTGASAGIGRATAIALAQAGARIIATGRRKPELDTLAKQCGGGAIETVVGDLNDARFVDDLANRAPDVDILVNNAGILKYAPLMDMTDTDCEDMFRTNVLASFRVTLAVARSMMERRRGHIIIMTSIAARGLPARRDLLRYQARPVGIRPRPATRVAGSRHQGHRNRSRDGRYRHPCQQRSPARARGPEGQKIRGAHVGGRGGGRCVCCPGRTQLLS